MAVHTERPADAFRTSVRELITDLVGPDWRGIGALDHQARRDFRMSTRAALAERGWVAPNWPVEYGGAGLGPREVVVLYRGTVGRWDPVGSDNDAFGIGMLGNTMLRWAKPELLKRFLPKIRLRRVHLRPGFLRTWCRFGPRVAGTARRSRRKPVGAQRSKAVVIERTPSELDVRPGAD